MGQELLEGHLEEPLLFSQGRCQFRIDLPLPVLIDLVAMEGPAVEGLFDDRKAGDLLGPIGHVVGDVVGQALGGDRPDAGQFVVDDPGVGGDFPDGPMKGEVVDEGTPLTEGFIEKFFDLRWRRWGPRGSRG